MKKRILSLALALVMLFSLTSPAAWAADVSGDEQPTNSAVNGKYTGDTWAQGGSGSVQHTIDDTTVTLSKTATPVAGALNTYDVTLSLVTSTTVVPQTNAAATVLVIDTSGSMRYCADCGADPNADRSSDRVHKSTCSHYQSGRGADNSIKESQNRMTAAKNAATTFLNSYAGTDTTAYRWLAIVEFNYYGEQVLGWTNVATAAGKQQAISAINGLSQDGGTNLDDGLYDANTLLGSSTIAQVPAAARNVIALTDGSPTYCRNADGTRYGFGSWTDSTIITRTTSTANTVKSATGGNAKLYTVCFGVATQSTYSGGPTVGNFLRDSIASPAEAASGDTPAKTYAYNADNTDQLMAAFTAITNSITNGLSGNGWVATDPMPGYISVSTDNEGNLPDGITTEDNQTYSWELSDPETSTSGGTTTYTYTVTYRIVIDHTQVEEGVYYPANAPTYLTVDGEQYAFPVPGVNAVYPEYTVTYEYTGDVPADAPAVPAAATYKYKDTVTVADAPTLEGYTFSGWSRTGTFEMPNNNVVITGSWDIRDDLTYTVNYYWNGTTTKVADSKVVSGQTFMDEVTEKPIDVSGYTPVSDESKTITIAVEGNKINFYYYQDVEIVANSDTKTYDGTEHSVSGFTGAPDDAKFDITVGATGIKAGTYPAAFAAGVVGTVDKTDKYIIAKATDGELIITPLGGVVVTITGNSAEVNYNGAQQSVTGYTVTSIKLNGKVTTLYTEEDFAFVGVNADKTAEGTNVGTHAMGLSADQFENKNSDFANVKFVIVDGQLEINPVDLTITADSNTKTYDGTALTDNGWEDAAPVGLKGADAVISVVVAGSQTVVGTSANVASGAVIKDGNGNDVTGNYTIEYKNGTLEVTKKAVTVTAADANKVYDGTPLTKNSYTNTALAAGDSIESVTVTGSQTVVGTSNNVPSDAKIVNAKGEDVTSSYDIEYVNGTLEVTPKTITVTAASKEKVYDGTALTLDSAAAEGLAEGDKMDAVTVTGSQTVVGTANNVPSNAKIVNADGKDVTASYTINYNNGTLEVTPKALTITADSDTKPYDGTPLTKDSYTSTALAAGDKFDSVTITGSQTVVGTSNNVPSEAKIVNAKGEDVTTSYAITYANGTLTVTQKAVTITAMGNIKTYDGTALTRNEYTNTALAEGDSIESVTITGSQTIVGKSDNVPSEAKIVNAAGEDVTDSYKITYANGTLEVTKRVVVLTSADDEKEYDGTPLTNDEVTVSDPGWAEGEGATYAVTGTQTLVGSSDNTFTYTLTEGTNAANYDITTEFGTLTVTNREVKYEITVEANSNSATYDGDEHTAEGFKTLTFEVDGQTYTVEGLTASVTQVNAGTYPNEITGTAVVKDDEGNDVTAQFAVIEVDGELVIDQKTLTIKADSGKKEYDGTPLTKNSYTDTGLAEGDEFESVTVTGSQTVAGSSKNVASAAKIVNANGDDVTDNYAIKYVDGQLTVTANDAAVVIEAASDSKKYDGSALTNDGYTYTELPEGHTIEAVVEGTITNVGTVANEVTSHVVKNADGENVTDSFSNITYVNGELKITKRSVTLTSATDEKVYNGTPLTNNNVTVSGDGWANGEGASYDNFASITQVGTTDNTFEYTLNEGTLTGNYDITVVPGTLKVTQKVLTITADSGEQVYNGKALTKDSYTNTALAKGDKFDSVTVTGSQTVVGESANVASAAKIINAAGEDVTASYAITYVDGKLEVTKKAITVTADSGEKVYDGEALTKNSYTADDLAEGDTFASVTVTGSQTVVGSSDNVPSEAKIVNTAGEDVTSSYAITYANGTLEVTEKKVTITADDATKTYDGSALTLNSYTNTALAAGDRIESVTVTGSQTVAGSSDNVPSAAKIVNAAGDDVTASYEITYVDGTLEVTKKAITVTADSDSKVYDATALTKDSFTNSELAEGDSIESVTVTGSQTVVGSSDNVPSAAVIKNAAGEDVTSSYAITYANGTLEITKKALTITADSDEKVYDATALTKDSYTNSDLATGDSITSVTVTGSQTVVGESDNVPSEAKIVNAAGDDVTASYDITYANGTLEVTQKTLTITADSDTKVYDGSALTKDSFTNTDLATGDSIESVTVTGSQTVVGTSDNIPSAAVIKNADGEDVTSSYAITYANGTLEVTQKTLTITADSGEKVYDATALTKDSFTNTALAAGDSIESVTVTGSQTVVGSSDNVPSAAVIKNAAGEDVTSSYDITYANGTLEVTQKEITVTAVSGSKIYDGEALVVNSYTSSDLAEGDKFASVTVTGSQTVVGSSDNVPSAAKIVNAAGEDVTASYKIAYVNGTLTVTEMAVTITADSDTKTYDATALTKDSYTNSDLAEGDRIESVTVTGSQTVVGSSENVPSAAKIVNADGEDVTASYKITYVNGTLEVTQKTLTITADSDTKIYDGSALTKDSYTNSDLAKSDRIESVTVTGSQTVVGSSDNVPSAAKIVNADGEDVTASYKITYVNGTLEVTQKTLTITAGSDTKVYDATALTKDSFTNTELAEGDRIESVTVTGSQTVVGSSANVPSAAKIVNADGEDVTSSYDITYSNGTLTVTQKALTITADSDTKVYDATALTKDSYTNTELADGDRIESVTVTGSQTVVGESDNVPSAAVIINADGEDVTDSYAITYSNGKLTVTQKALTITADSDTKVYDATALTKDSYTNTDLATGDSIASVTVTGSQTVVGESDNVPSAAVIINADGEDVTASYNITYSNGTLTVTKKALTITADSDSKVYDATALTKDSYTNTDLAAGDSFKSVTVTGSQTVVGESDNVPSAAVIINADGEDVTASYDITYVNGTLTVTQKALTITADSDSKVYDATALTKDSYTNTALATGDSFASVTLTGSQTVVGKSDNVASEAKIVNADGEDVTASYEITYVKGELEVTPKAITVTADSASKMYDGTPLTKDSYTSSDLAEGDSFASVTVTGSQTVVGESDNVPSDAIINNAAGEDVTASYEITYVNGKLVVNKHTDAELVAEGYTGVYDGLEHEGVTAKDVTGDVEGDEWVYTYSIDGETYTEEMPKYQDVGNYTVYVKAENPNYEGDKLITTVPVVITPATIVVTADDHTIATGDPDPELTYQFVTPVESETPSFSGELVRESGSGKGEYPINQGTLALADGEGFKASNYVLEYVPGELTILLRALDLVKTVDKDKVRVGDTITYTITVTNIGEVELTNVTVYDPMMPGVEITIPDLAVGESWTTEYKYVPTEEDADKIIVNIAIVGDDEEKVVTEVMPPIPDTGDHTPVTLLGVTMLLSAAGIILMLRKQRKEENV